MVRGPEPQSIAPPREAASVQHATRAEIAPGTLSRVERGTIGVSLEVLERLATALGVSPAQLLDFDGELRTPEDTVQSVVDGIPRDAELLRDRVARAVRLLVDDG